jgi:hypothetical protein
MDHLENLGMDWIQLVKDKIQSLAVLIAVTNIEVPQKMKYFVSRWAAVDFSRTFSMKQSSCLKLTAACISPIFSFLVSRRNEI